ncbi:MAG: cytochrome c maturation protein CcmE [Nitrospirota bacterium]|nr:cytochrome c maturation protein CcmE [Nitrospirota bacterium]
MVTLLSHHTARRSSRASCALVLLAALLSLISLPLLVQASNLLEIAELLTHPEQYDRQEVVVTGQVTNVQLATNRQGQPAYGFLLKDQAGTLKVISLGQIEVREGDQVIVEGVFSRLRQAGRTIIYNEIKALSIKPMNRLNPDLVG